MLKSLSKEIYNWKIKLSEKDILNFLKNKKRWPMKYPWGEFSIAFINNLGTKQSLFFDQEGYLDFNRWLNYYEKGYTCIIHNVLDLNEDLRKLDNYLKDKIGTEINANFYISKPGQRASFFPHSHNYPVIVKQIYGNTTWIINDNKVVLKPQKTILIPIQTTHEVISNDQNRLSLTINIE